MALKLTFACCILGVAGAMFQHMKDTTQFSHELDEVPGSTEEQMRVSKFADDRANVDSIIADMETVMEGQMEHQEKSRQEKIAADRRRQERVEEGKAKQKAWEERHAEQIAERHANQEASDKRRAQHVAEAKANQEAWERRQAERIAERGAARAKGKATAEELARAKQASALARQKMIEERAAEKATQEATLAVAAEERAIAIRLGEEASFLRREAELAGTHADTHKHMIRDINGSDLVDLIINATKDEKVLEVMDGLCRQGEAIVVQFSRKARIAVEELSAAAARAPDSDAKFRRLLNRFMENEFGMFDSLVAELTSIFQTVSKTIPAQLAGTIQPSLLVLVPRLDPLSMFHESMKVLQFSEACDTITANVSAGIGPYFERLQDGRNLLDAAAYGFSDMANHTRVSTQVKLFVASTMKVSYIANLALEKAARNLAAVVQKVIVDRFHCDRSSANSKGLGLMASMSSALVAWLLV